MLSSRSAPLVFVSDRDGLDVSGHQLSERAGCVELLDAIGIKGKGGKFVVLFVILVLVAIAIVLSDSANKRKREEEERQEVQKAKADVASALGWGMKNTRQNGRINQKLTITT